MSLLWKVWRRFVSFGCFVTHCRGLLKVSVRRLLTVSSPSAAGCGRCRFAVFSDFVALCHGLWKVSNRSFSAVSSPSARMAWNMSVRSFSAFRRPLPGGVAVVATLGDKT
ncbi:unnamed protein product [Laminaria digitata]